MIVPYKMRIKMTRCVKWWSESVFTLNTKLINFLKVNIWKPLNGREGTPEIPYSGLTICTFKKSQTKDLSVFRVSLIERFKLFYVIQVIAQGWVERKCVKTSCKTQGKSDLKWKSRFVRSLKCRRFQSWFA